MTDSVLDPPRGSPGFALAGDLTIHCAAERRVELIEKLRGQVEAAVHDELQLDLSALADIDSAGLQILVAARHWCAERGHSLRLSACSATVQEALDAFRLDEQLFPVDLPAAERARLMQGVPA